MLYAKSEAGQAAFKQRSTQMTARQRSAFILADGLKSGEQLLAASSVLGVTQDDLNHLVAVGFLQEVKEVLAPGAYALLPQPVPVDVAQARYAVAWPLATQLTASLGLRGFRLNLAVESAAGYHDLLALLPKIQAAVGVANCVKLERTLRALEP
jgi:hypothetical protein